METLDELKARLRKRLAQAAESNPRSALTQHLPNEEPMSDALTRHLPDREATPAALTQHLPDEEAMPAALTQHLPDGQAPAALTQHLPDGEAPVALTQHLPEGEAPVALTQHVPNEEPMPTLTDEIRTFIVKALARYDTPLQVVAAVRENFGIEITRQQAYNYDPRSSQRLAPRWKEIHAATRQAFLREVAEIGVAQKAVRLAMLDRMAHEAMSDHYFIKAAGFLEQAAKECGGIYENRRPVVLQLSAAPAEAEGVIDATPLRRLADAGGTTSP